MSREEYNQIVPRLCEPCIRLSIFIQWSNKNSIKHGSQSRGTLLKNKFNDQNMRFVLAILLKFHWKVTGHLNETSGSRQFGLIDNFIDRKLDNARRSRFPECGDDGSDDRFIENRINGDPVGIRKIRNRRLL